MKAAILYDSSAYVTAPLKERNDLFQVDFTLVLPNDKIIVESIDERHLDDFFDQWMQDGVPQPKTAQPSMQDYHTAFQKLIDEGYDTVFGVFLSSSVSGTFQTAESVSREYEDQLKIINIDAVGLSVNMEQLIQQLVSMIDAGWSFDKMKDTVTCLVAQSRFFIALEKNDHLIKGGRGEALSELKKSPLKIRPVLEYVPGSTPVLKEQFRTTKQRNNHLAQLTVTYQERYPDHTIQVSIGHTHSEYKAQSLKDAIQEILPNQAVDIRMIGTAFCSHLGRDALSFGLMPVAEGIETND